MFVTVERNDSILSISLSDSGIPFNPLEHEDPDTSIEVDNRTIGGLGIFLVKQIMDSVEYTNKDGQNCITIRKAI